MGTNADVLRDGKEERATNLTVLEDAKTKESVSHPTPVSVCLDLPAKTVRKHNVYHRAATVASAEKAEGVSACPDFPGQLVMQNVKGEAEKETKRRTEEKRGGKSTSLSNVLFSAWLKEPADC